MWDFLSGPASSLIGKVSDAVDSLHTSGEEKAAIRMEIVKAERDFHRDVLKAENEWAATQAEVIKSEVQGQSVLARNWRPILMLTFTYIVAHNYVIASVFGLTILEIPPDMWSLLRIGIGGYIGGRTLEKVLPGAVQAFKK